MGILMAYEWAAVKNKTASMHRYPCSARPEDEDLSLIWFPKGLADATGCSTVVKLQGINTKVNVDGKSSVEFVP